MFAFALLVLAGVLALNAVRSDFALVQETQDIYIQTHTHDNSRRPAQAREVTEDCMPLGFSGSSAGVRRYLRF